MRYVIRVEEACLEVHGVTWLSPRDASLIRGLVLDVGVPLSNSMPVFALMGPGRQNLAEGRVPIAGFPNLERAPVVRTGISMGPVSVELSDVGSMPALEVSAWEDVAEFSVLVRDKPAYLGGFGQDDRDVPRIGTAGPGWYRLLVHTRGRSVAPDLVVAEPTEEYWCRCGGRGRGSRWRSPDRLSIRRLRL
ncbi:hypothetical protein [Promicromonospora sp. NPDC019610]|uniref:hypothetical protein n=1 Tax=Promicromonospora sp. NPDC019610 TaxID=3364405 RepID=UPI0037A917EC